VFTTLNNEELKRLCIEVNEKIIKEILEVVVVKRVGRRSHRCKRRTYKKFMSTTAAKSLGKLASTKEILLK